jgi:cation diffusion facilitator CzcD-associated flavoprotein CzcO
MDQTNRAKALIIGAGPAGLAAAGALTFAGIPYVILERNGQVGCSWRNHYERLHLHTTRRTSGLPHWPFPKSYPTYPSRQNVVDYLERYAEHFRIAPRFGEPVVKAARRSGGWDVETAKGRYAADNLIVATGYNAAPVRPTFPGMEKFRGRTLHSSAYRNAGPHLGRRVLVVGCGNSGAEIALDLSENGVDVTLAIRSPIHVIPRDLGGVPFIEIAIANSFLPLAVADFIALATLRLAVGDLQKYGIQRPALGPAALVEKFGRVSLIDVGTLAAIKRGTIKTSPGVERFTAAGVRFVGGREAAFDDVLFATGYQARLDQYLEGAAQFVNERGLPKWHGREVDSSGLYFLGFRNPVTGMLREIRLEAERIAADLKRKNRPR